MTGTKPAENTTEPQGLAAAAPVATSKPQTIREFERALKGLGYSQREACAIAKSGFHAIGGNPLDELAELLAKNIQTFKEKS